MLTKKDIPFELLKTIEPLAQANLDIIQFKREDNTFYFFVERDSNSKNFFKILIDGSKQVRSYDSTKYTLEWKPTNASNVKHITAQTILKELTTIFQNWLDLIRKMHEMPSVHDDNFIKHYAEFYYNEFKIVDDDADISPFNPDQQELIEAYLISLSSAIENSEGKLSDVEKAELTNDIHLIQTGLPATTKNQIMKGITKIFGKLYKISKELGKEIVKEAKKNLIKKLIELGIEYGPKLLEMFSKP